MQRTDEQLAHERESMKVARKIRAQRQKEEEKLERMSREMQEKKGKR